MASDANRQLTADGNAGLFFRLVEPPGVSLSLSNGTVQVRWTSFTNAAYRVDAKSSVQDTIWVTLTSNVTASGNSKTWTDSMVPLGRFYRVVLLP